MPEWVFIGYLILAFISLGTVVFWSQWKARGKDGSAYGTLMILFTSIAASLLLMVPLFYIVYVGMIPKWRYGITYFGANLILPLGWAHLAVFAWRTGRTVAERYAPGIGFFLTIPVLFLGVWVGAMVRFRYSILLADWALLLVSLTIWLASRSSRRGGGGRQ